MKRIKFILSGDHNDKTIWSGTISFMAEFLEKHYQVDYIRVDNNVWGILGKMFSRMIKHFSLNKYKHTMAVPRLLKVFLERKINSSNCDIIFAPNASEYIALCIFNKPLIYLTDATFHLMQNYYYFDVSEHDKKIRDFQERQSLEMSTINIFSNQWAADDAIAYYGIEKNKTTVIPFGNNLYVSNHKFERHDLSDEIRLLFVGADYKRKGGNIAIETMKWLNENDHFHKYSIDMVGMDGIEKYENEPYVTYHGFINKNTSEGMQRIVELYQNADIYVFPTRAECCSMTLQEASSFALPTIAYDTGGVGSAIIDGINGFLMKPESSPEDFGKKILEMIRPEIYLNLCKTTFEYYKVQLNWDVWLNSFINIVDDILKSSNGIMSPHDTLPISPK